MAADVFLHVAEYEGLPLAILEAMSAGLPCAISSNLLSEMPFLNPENSISVGDDGRWLAVLADSTKRDAIGAAARHLVEQKYSYAQMAEAYEALYLEVLGKR
jgi:glycosyltransferase involved in cell wall biosynthesis